MRRIVFSSPRNCCNCDIPLAPPIDCREVSIPNINESQPCIWANCIKPMCFFVRTCHFHILSIYSFDLFKSICIYIYIPASSKGCCLNPKGWCIGTPYHPFSTLERSRYVYVDYLQASFRLAPKSHPLFFVDHFFLRLNLVPPAICDQFYQTPY